MARFASTQTSEGDAIGTLADAIVAHSAIAYNAVTSDGPTLTAAQMVNGIVKISGQTGAQAVTTPTATAIVAAIPNAQVGSMFWFALINAHTPSGAATLTAGAGVTLSSITDVVAVANSQIYIGRVTATATPAVTIYGLLTAGA